jgi:hypothetical protein
VLDAIITKPVDVTFDLIWRHGDASPDTVLASWMEHYEPLGGANYDAQPFEYDQTCDAITYASGDQLVFRYTGANGTSMESYIPDGDGQFANGRIPYITLPR